MRADHLFIPDKNVIETDYISLIDIILSIENISEIELQHLKDECARKMKYFQEHIISDEEYRQLKHIHFKNTYSPQHL
jgi:hypothetical protein